MSFLPPPPRALRSDPSLCWASAPPREHPQFLPGSGSERQTDRSWLPFQDDLQCSLLKNEHVFNLNETLELLSKPLLFPQRSSTEKLCESPRWPLEGLVPLPTVSASTRLFLRL